MKFLFIFVVFLCFRLEAETLQFDGAIGLLICPASADDCFRSIVAQNITVATNLTYEDNTILIEVAQWNIAATIQSIDVFAALNILKTTYKTSGETYYDLEMQSWSSTTDPSKLLYSIKSVKDFNGVLTITGVQIKQAGPLRQTLFLMAPAGYRLL